MSEVNSADDRRAKKIWPDDRGDSNVVVHGRPVDLWKTCIAAVGDPDRKTSVRPILRMLDVQRLSIWERMVSDPGDRQQDRFRFLFQSHLDEPTSQQLRDVHLLWKREIRIPPRYATSSSSASRFQKTLTPITLGELNAEDAAFFERMLEIYNTCLGYTARDMVLLPLPETVPQCRIRAMSFQTTHRVSDPTPFVLAGMVVLNAIDYAELMQHPTTRSAAESTVKTREIVYWAVKGKTLEEISSITGYSVKSVRYHLYKLREQYGFATVTQTLVHAAKRFGFDP